MPATDDETRTLPDRAPAADRAEQSLYGDELAPGALTGEYVIQGTIARGGCGTVYSAEHRVLGRRAAVKLLHREMATSPEMLERFVREARAVNLIRHPNIVDIFEFGQLQDGRPYYVMELLEGSSLEALIRQQGRFSAAEALEMLEPICLALDAAHRAGVVHRDLKAANIAVQTVTGRRAVKLLDFGIAKLMHPEAGESGLTSVGRRLGTPHAMAPEQIRGEKVDERTDVYALGVLLFHLLTGSYPFSADDPMEVERQHLEASPPRPSQFSPVAPTLDAVVLRCMEKEPDARYPSAPAFLDGLREAVGGPSRRAQTPAGAAATAPAVAIYIETRIGPADDMDDALLDEIADILDAAERELRAADFTFPLQTGSALLAARMLQDDQADRQRAFELALALHRQIQERPARDSRLYVNLIVHVDRAIVRERTGGFDIVGGALLRLAAWAPQHDLPGPCATPQAAEGIALPAGLAIVGGS